MPGSRRRPGGPTEPAHGRGWGTPGGASPQARVGNTGQHQPAGEDTGQRQLMGTGGEHRAVALFTGSNLVGDKKRVRLQWPLKRAFPCFSHVLSFSL